LAFTNPLILVPKCECPEGYEGDFCENRMLDECDRKDLEVHKAYLEETETTDSTMLQMANETFFRNIKTKLGQWNPAHSSNEGIMATQAFERALRSRGINLKKTRLFGLIMSRINPTLIRYENILWQSWILSSI
jgi:hypothetical protein